MQRGFFASLFDISFTSFITTKIIKVLYVLALIGIALTALAFVIIAFKESTGAGIAVLFVVAPLSGLIYAIYTRVFLEFVIQVFRIAELMRDQNTLQRAAFANAGWLPDGAVTTAAPALPVPAMAASTGSAAPTAVSAAPTTAERAEPVCPNCGAAITPEAKFCRRCGHQLS